MKEYIKKFGSAASANNYAITDIPFMTSVAPSSGYPLINYIQNLVCNKTGKHLENDNGTVIICPPDVDIEMVDLGLSVKWADANLGATNADTVESWYGDYYAWGEIETKSDYSWGTYTRHTNGTFSSSNKKVFTKYIPTDKESEYWGGTGPADNKLVLDSVDDVATVTNSAWRMPTKAECEELLDTTKIDNVWINNYDPTKSEHTPADDGGISGLNGRLFTSKIEGHVGAKIFIPAAGSFYGSSNDYDGSSSEVWSTVLYSTDIYPYNPCTAWRITFNSGHIGIGNYDRCCGMSVRCVSTD